MDTPGTFQRARRPEQVAERRAAILATARDLLARRRAADVSLRELADAVGLAMSNVLRYFDSREAIFAQILDAEWRDWLEELAVALPAATRGLGQGGFARPRHSFDLRRNVDQRTLYLAANSRGGTGFVRREHEQDL